MLSRPSSLLRPPPTPSRPPATSRLPVIDGLTPDPRRAGPRRASPVPVTTFWTFHAPYAGEVHRHPLQVPRRLPWPSPNPIAARLPLVPASAGNLDDAAGFASCCGPPSCSAPLRLPASRPTPEASLPGTLASPRTGLAPAGCRKLVARLRHDRSFAIRRPSCWTHVDQGLANHSTVGVIRPLLTGH